MKLGLKFNKNTLLSVVFAIVLIVFALYLIKALDKTGREGINCPGGGTAATPAACVALRAKAQGSSGSLNT